MRTDDRQEHASANGEGKEGEEAGGGDRAWIASQGIPRQSSWQKEWEFAGKLSAVSLDWEQADESSK